MAFKETTGHLVKAGLVKPCPTDVQAITKLIRRAYLDLRTAKRNLEEDQECTYTYAYNAMLRSGLALMFSEGYRPEIKDKHRTIVRFASAVLGEGFHRLITDYDFMRKKRHQFIYEPDIPCSMTEASEALNTARTFVDQVAESIRAKSPQREFHFGKEPS